MGCFKLLFFEFSGLLMLIGDDELDYSIIPSNSVWLIIASIFHTENNPTRSNEEMIGVLVGTLKIRNDLPPTHGKDQMGESKKNCTRKSHGASPCSSK